MKTKQPSQNEPRQHPQGRRSRGMTFIELLVAISVLAILATVAVPMMRWDDKRRRENHLRVHLSLMRTAIDQYKEKCDLGMIMQEDVEQRCYPLTLEDLLEGVEVIDPTAQSPEPKVIRFLMRIPIDPFTETEEWGLRSYQDDWDSDSWGGENIYDVYSLSHMIALDETYYRDW
jgi:general secretion pathway protein G